MSKKHPEYSAKGLHVIGIFESANQGYMAEYIGSQSPPFPIIADPEKKLYVPYGLETSAMGLLKSMFQPIKLYQTMVVNGNLPKPTKIDSTVHRMPADFLLDEDLKVHKVHYGRDIGDHISDYEIENFLAGTVR